MGDDSKNIQITFGPDSSDNMHSFVVTETVDFCWDVKQFKGRLQNKAPNFELESPLFKIGDDSNSRHQWRLSIRTNSGDEVESYSLYLNNVNSSKYPIHTEFFVELMNTGTTWLKSNFECQFTKAGGRGWPKLFTMAQLLNPENKLLEDDTLKLRCQIKIKENNVQVVNGVKSEAERRSLKRKRDAISNLTTLFHSQTFVDVSIQTKNSILKAHKAVLSCQSPVFSAMLQSEMSEAINNLVVIQDFDDEVVKGMLEYIYSGEISQECLSEYSHELLKIADKYDIKGLLGEAEEHIAANLSVENAVDTLILADMNKSFYLKSKVISFINKNKAGVEKAGGFQKILSYSRFMFEELYMAQLKEDSDVATSEFIIIN